MVPTWEISPPGGRGEIQGKGGLYVLIDRKKWRQWALTKCGKETGRRHASMAVRAVWKSLI